jgi:hypothetical protein
MMRALDLVLGRTGLFVVAGLLVGASAVQASELAFDFSNVFNGPPIGPAVAANSMAVEAVFEDVSPGAVRLTVSNLNLTANENVAKLYFNLNPNLNPAELQFQLEAGSGFVGPSVVTGARANLGPGLRFNVSLGFRNHGDSSRTFGAGEFLSELITGIPTLTAADFSAYTTRRTSPDKFYAVAEINRIAVNSQTEWFSSDCPKPIVPAPEPGARALLSAMIGTWLACWSCKRGRQIARANQLQRIPIRRTRPAPPSRH